MNTKDQPARSPLHHPHIHDSAYRHTTGEARYVDDDAGPHGTLVAWIVTSPHAHASILSLQIEQAKQAPGIHAVLTSQHIPGDNLIGPIFHDEPLLADKLVHFQGQAVALVVGESEKQCREAAALVKVEYAALPHILSIHEAIDKSSFHGPAHVIKRGECKWQDCTQVIEAEVSNGGQDHFYLETQAALAIPLENDAYHIYSSSQHPTEIQKMAAHVLGIGAHQVVCEVPRMGGGFGGKESQATQFGVLAALAAKYTRRPVKCWLNRDQDMRQTGKRHPFWSRYKAGFDDQGTLQAFQVEIYSNAGWTSDLSLPVLDRALFHLDNTYFIPNLHFTGRCCNTNLPSNTAFRGFGGPQGVLVVEDAINRYSERVGVDPALVRQRNFYGPAPRNKAPYGQVIKDNRLPRIYEELMASSDYTQRRRDIDAFNEKSKYTKRGIGFQAVKFGISFTKSLLNQAGSLIQMYTDGTVQLSHAGTEMGQGLYAKMMVVCAHELGLRLDMIRNMQTSTDKVPNTSPTAASSGADLNGQAVKNACVTLRSRLIPVAAKLLQAEVDEELHFEGGWVSRKNAPDERVSISQVANQAWVDQVSLSATGYYATPGIAYDQAKGRGTPFYYFAYGGCITEIELSTLTGEYRILRTDILHDVGDSLIPSIDRGQVEGGYIQGVGWLGSEDVLFSPEGRLLTYSPSTYKIPAFGDVPQDFRVNLLQKAPQLEVIHGSKAVGEPPFVLAISMVTALRHAIASCDSSACEVELEAPCTVESVLRSLAHQQGEEPPPRDDVVRI